MTDKEKLLHIQERSRHFCDLLKNLPNQIDARKCVEMNAQNGLNHLKSLENRILLKDSPEKKALDKT